MKRAMPPQNPVSLPFPPNPARLYYYFFPLFPVFSLFFFFRRIRAPPHPPKRRTGDKRPPPGVETNPAGRWGGTRLRAALRENPKRKGEEGKKATTAARSAQPGAKGEVGGRGGGGVRVFGVCACVCVCARAPFCFFVGFYSQDGSWLLKFHNLEGNGLHRNKLNHNAEFVLSSVSVCPSVRPPPPPPLLSLSLSLPLSSQRGSARGGPAPTAPPAPLPRGAAGRCGPGPRPRSARRSAFSSAARCRRGAPPYRSWVAGGVASLLGSFWGGGEAFVWVVRLGRFRLFGLVSVARFAFQSGSGENPGCQLFCPPSGAQGRACSSCWC